jgi:hypothetical protein
MIVLAVSGNKNIPIQDPIVEDDMHHGTWKKHGKNANIISSSQQNQKQVNVGGNVDECKDVGFGQHTITGSFVSYLFELADFMVHFGSKQ